jgi:hypothetical protein
LDWPKIGPANDGYFNFLSHALIEMLVSLQKSFSELGRIMSTSWVPECLSGVELDLVRKPECVGCLFEEKRRLHNKFLLKNAAPLRENSRM